MTTMNWLELADRFEKIEAELKAYKLLVESSDYGLELNMNDIFGWGCADSETLSGEDAEELIPIIQKYGFTALIAYVSVKRQGAIPQGPVLKDCKKDFYSAQKEIQTLSDKGNIMFEEYFYAKKRREEMKALDGQVISWTTTGRFANLLNEQPDVSRYVIQVAKLKDGTTAVGRSNAETTTRILKKFARKKAKMTNDIR